MTGSAMRHEAVAPAGRSAPHRALPPKFMLFVLDLFFKLIFHIAVPPDRGRSHETHANGEGCGACGFGLVNRISGGPRRHRSAQLCGSVRQRAGGADESGGNPVESRAFVNGRPCPFPEGGPGDEGKRRGEAPIGAPVRVMGRLFPPAGGTGFAVRLSHQVRRSAPALVGALPPRMGAFPNGGRAHAPPERWSLAR